MTRMSLARVLPLALLCSLPATAQNRQVELEWLRNAGATFTGSAANDKLGHSLAAAGDVNGDGVGDFLVGAPQNSGDVINDPPGRVYLFFGAPGVTLGGPAATTADVTFIGNDNGWQTGYAVAGAGDVDGDGYDDVLIGAPRAETNGNTQSGRAWLIWGDPALSGSIDLSTLPSALGVTINGAQFGDLLGAALSGAGDMDGDGLPDLLLGANGEGTAEGANGRGAAYVLYGDAALPALVEIEAPVGASVTKFVGVAGSDDTGESLAGAGDVDGDGLADVILGAERAPAGAATNGAAYIVYGDPALPATVNLATLGALGTTISGAVNGDQFGHDVAGGGDVNDDGFADPVIGGFTVKVGSVTEAGRVYLLFGGPALGNAFLSSAIGVSKGGLTFDGIDANDRAGAGVAAGGDFNGDGVSDLALTANGGDPNGDANAGEVYLFFGRNSLVLGSVALGALEEEGLVLAGVAPQDAAGSATAMGDALAFAGDVDGDGFGDLLVGSEASDPAGTSSGSAWLLKGTCNVMQAAGPVAEGGSLNLRMHGTPGVANLTFASVIALPTPLATGLGPWWLVNYFTLLAGSFQPNGEQLFTLPMPAPGAIPGLQGLTVHMQTLGAPQGENCDLTYLLSFTIE